MGKVRGRFVSSHVVSHVHAKPQAARRLEGHRGERDDDATGDVVAAVFKALAEDHQVQGPKGDLVPLVGAIYRDCLAPAIEGCVFNLRARARQLGMAAA